MTKEYLPSLSHKEKKIVISEYSAHETVKESVEAACEKINKLREREAKKKGLKTKKSKGYKKVSKAIVKTAMKNIESLIDEEGVNKRAKDNDKKHYIEKRYAELAAKLKRYPTMIDLGDIGISRAEFRETHGKLAELRKSAKVSFSSYFSKIYEWQDILNDITRAWIKKTIRENDIFTVYGLTSAPSTDRIKVIMKFHEIEGGVPIFIPMAKRLEDIDQKIVDLFLQKKCILALEDIDINQNLKIKYVNTNEKSASAITGYSAMEPGKSLIFAGIKQEFTPLPTKKGSHPRMHISTGTISANHHRSSINHNLSAHSRSIQKAESNHFFGGWLVEKHSDRIFIPTQIMMPGEKNFTIYGRKYSKTGVTYKAPDGYVFGDSHDAEKNVSAIQDSLDYSKTLGIKECAVHDIFDCMSSNAHDHDKLCLGSYKALRGKSSTSIEMKDLVETFNVFTKVFKKVNVVDSNHDDMLRRALDSQKMLKDRENSLLAALLLPAAIFSYFERDEEGLDIATIVNRAYGIPKDRFLKHFGFLKDAPRLLEFAVDLFGVERADQINWLDLESQLRIGGFDLSEHGHKGSNGAKGSLLTFSKTFYKSITGHTHTPSQSNYNLSVGHNTDTRPGHRPLYALGGTSTWMIADAMVYENEGCEGVAHHVFKINGYRSRFLDQTVLKNLVDSKKNTVGANKLKQHIDKRPLHKIYEEQMELVA